MVSDIWTDDTNDLAGYSSSRTKVLKILDCTIQPLCNDFYYIDEFV